VKKEAKLSAKEVADLKVDKGGGRFAISQLFTVCQRRHESAEDEKNKPRIILFLDERI